MEQNFAAMNKTNVYWFNRDREALVQLVLVRSNFYLDSHLARHEWAEKDGDPKKVVMVIEYDPQEPGKLPLFYKTTEDFEKGKTMNSDEMLWMRDEKDICEKLLRDQYSRLVFADEKGVYIWSYIKGQAVKWYFRKHIDVVTCHYVNGTIDKITSDAEGGVPVSYSSVGEVYQYNDWTEVTEQGERVKHEGVYNRLRLEPDQEELAKKLQEAIDACREAKMNVYFNLCNYDLNAVNMRHVERIEYDPEVDEDTELAYEFDDGRAGHMFSGVYDLNSEDSSLKFVIKK